MRIEPDRPVADGIPFDDLHGMTDAQKNLLASRGVVFVTRFRDGGREYGGLIVATCMAAAEEVAFGRALGEEVVGVLVETGRVPDGFGQEWLSYL